MSDEFRNKEKKTNTSSKKEKNQQKKKAVIKNLDGTTKKQTPKEKQFRMISKIEPQKRKGRYNVYIDNEFAFGIDEEVLIKYELNKGLHVTPEFQKTIEKEDSYYKIYQKTLNYLSYSLRSEKEIRDYLAENEVYHFSDRIIEDLKELKLLDDLNYAASYVRTQMNMNQKGPQNITQDLYQRGISDEDIAIALEEYSYDEQLENAITLAEKRWRKTKNNSQFESIQKVKKYLVNKGYSFEVADEALDAIDTEKDDELEYEALVKQAEKACRRYARKYEGYELIQRLKAYLYSKAYPTELINRYIDERELE